MPLPDPRPGLVFRYEYVWKRQERAGQTVGEKERPACVVLAITGESGQPRVLIVPITTRQPADGTPALIIPAAVKRHLGLDADRPSWIVLDEANIDTWPSPDMRPIPGQKGRFAYGLLPQRMVNDIRRVILGALAEKRTATVDRTSDDQ